MKILICGLPGSGKSTLAEKLTNEISKNCPVEWINADAVRQQVGDWDFSSDGRLRQAQRMRSLALAAESNGIVAICDFVCPTKLLRAKFKADITIWMDTIESSRYHDTNQLFEPLDREEYDFRITELDSDRWSQTLADLIWILE